MQDLSALGIPNSHLSFGGQLGFGSHGYELAIEAAARLVTSG